ncbi:MAG: M50 family metallopeptidase [Lachnospirales bacterium]
MSIIIAIIIFGLIVFVHELGHFLLAKKNGILVEEFAIGMGPAIWSSRKGETKYSIRALPLGGYCSMLGEDSDNFDDRSFNSKGVYARMSVILAGAFFNAVLALVIFMGFSLFDGFRTLEIDTVVEDSFAGSIGLQSGDVIKEINGNRMTNYNEIFFETMFSQDGSIDLVYEREGEKYEASGTMQINPETSNYYIGVLTKYKRGVFASDIEGYEHASFFESVKMGVNNTTYIVESTFLSFKLLFNRTIGMESMSGPVGIVGTIETTYDESMESGGVKYAFLNMLNLMAFLSANLAVFNVLPLPALDGGRFVFLVYEAITKKRVPPEKEGFVHFVGFALLMSFAVFVTFNDIVKIIK